MQPIDMHVDDVEFIRVSGNRLQLRCLGDHRVCPRTAEAKSLWPNGVKFGGGLGISAGKQRYLVSQPYQLIDKPRYHPLGTAIKLGRNAFCERRYLGNSHRFPPCTSQGLSDSGHWPFSSKLAIIR